MNASRWFSLVLIVAVICLTALSTVARADEPVCVDVWVAEPPPFGSLQRVCAGDYGGGSPPPGDCPPGTTAWQYVFVQDPLHPEECFVLEQLVDVCSGEVLQEGHTAYDVCPGPGEAGENPCETLTASGGGFTCLSQWLIEVRVGFPETFLDARPFPVTLVRWPTALRNGGQPPASGTGELDYIGYGGGDPEDPEVGDWRDVRLILILEPAGPLFVSLPAIGSLALPYLGAEAPALTVQWQVPSHPEAGGSALAGEVTGLEALPADLPLFAGSGRTPYRLFWRLTYEKYIKVCQEGPDDSGSLQCKTKKSADVNDGHWEYRWRDRSAGGEITPGMVADLPESLAADLNGDGIAEAYWNHNLTIRRMDGAGQVEGPWAAAWNWGGTIYWAVREGQGQIGWP